MDNGLKKLQGHSAATEDSLATAVGALSIESVIVEAKSSATTAITAQNTASPSACSRVLAIPELITLILKFIAPLQVAPKEAHLQHNTEDPRSAAVQARANNLWTLLHAQRVNHTWRNLIKSTPSLRHCLFIAPHTSSTASWVATGPRSSQPILNPLIQTLTHWRLSHLPPDRMSGKYSAHLIIERKDHEHLLSLPANQKAMLLSQPPVTCLAATIWERETEPESGQARVRPPSSFYAVKHIRDEGGVVLGVLLDRVGQMFEDVTLKAIKIETV